MATINEFMRSNGYRYNTTKGVGTLRYVRPEYDLWLKVEGKQRILGIQVDHKWKWFHIGYLYNFGTKSTVNRYNIVRLTRNISDTTAYFEELEGRALGGEKEKLG